MCNVVCADQIRCIYKIRFKQTIRFYLFYQLQLNFLKYASVILTGNAINRRPTTTPNELYRIDIKPHARIWFTDFANEKSFAQ